MALAACAALLLIVLLASGTTQAASRTQELVFEGTVETVIDYYDYCNPQITLQYAGRRTYSKDIQVILGDLVDDGDFEEDNPFHLLAQTATTASEGDLTLDSAEVFTTPLTGRSLLIQYWQLSLSGKTLTGELINDGKAEAAVSNLLYGADLLVPCRSSLGSIPKLFTIAEGATLTGNLTTSSIKFTLTGSTYDQSRVFSATVSAKLVK